MQAEKWDGVPSKISRLLSYRDDKGALISEGFGYGPGDTMIFGTKHGDISVKPGQWVVLDDDGRASVSDEDPLDNG